jgi:hypothetical protein
MEKPREGDEETLKLKQRFITMLSHSLTEYSDEIPQEIKRGPTTHGVPATTHKVQSNWLGPALSTIQLALQKFPNGELERSRKSFWEKFQASDAAFSQAKQEGRATEPTRRHTREEVDEVNTLLEGVIQHLENSM